jgi:hypothetical protein
MIRLRDLKLPLAKIRALEAMGDFPPIEWTGPRSGLVWREDWEKWKATRHERARQRRDGEAYRRDFISNGQRAATFDAVLKRS